MKLFFRIAMLWGMIVFCFGCGMQENGERQDKDSAWQCVDTAMGTVVQQTVYGSGEAAEDFFGQARAALTELEQEQLSWRLETSEVYRMNQWAGKEEGCGIPEDMARLLQACLELGRRSGGNFDISLGQLTRLWNIDKWAAGENEDIFGIPSEEEIQEALRLCGSAKIRLTGDGPDTSSEEFRVYLPEGMQLDLGAVGKGLALSALSSLLGEETRITGAVISLGGSILTWGEKPDGSPWKVGVMDPFDTASNVGILTLEGEWCISTSGDYERYVEADGVRYHHILDPATGYPADSGVKGVTILAEDGLLSDGLSTACFLLGPEEGIALAEEYGAEVLFVMEDGEIVMSEGMEKYFREN